MKSVKIFCEQYLEKLFYFSLKKTSNRQEAEDLSSEIALEIISALQKNIVPDNFSAWVWKIARNHYSKWAKRKHISQECISDINIDEYDEILPDSNFFEQDLISKEQIYLLRRELSLISKDYRDIVVAFYIEDKKVEQISKELNLPVGTVKTKLFRCRKILKEGMNMAREFGAKSYKPEDVHFVKSGNEGWDGSPWSLLNRKIPNNILLAAYDNPLTIEELSLELGIAVPYMEEEAEKLAEATLLKKEGNKYETNFVILSREAQDKIHKKQNEIIEKMNPLAIEIVKVVGEEADKSGNVLLGGYQTFEELKWLLLLRLSDDIVWAVCDKHGARSGDYTVRPKGGKWDIIGFEGKKDDAFPFVGLHGGHCEDVGIGNYKIYAYGLENRAGEIYENESRTLKKVITGDIANCDKDILENLVKRGFLIYKDGYYKPTIAVAHKNAMIDECVSEKVYNELIAPKRNKMLELEEELYSYTREILEEEIPKKLHNQLDFCIETIPCNTRGAFIVYGVENGFLKIPQNIDKSTIAMYINI